MKILKSHSFKDADKIAAFVNTNNIAREDILIIVGLGFIFSLFYYAEE
jgi:hypothetical protein